VQVTSNKSKNQYYNYPKIYLQHFLLFQSQSSSLFSPKTAITSESTNCYIHLML
jgi:hypothetical protein